MTCERAGTSPAPTIHSVERGRISKVVGEGPVPSHGGAAWVGATEGSHYIRAEGGEGEHGVPKAGQDPVALIERMCYSIVGCPIPGQPRPDRSGRPNTGMKRGESRPHHAPP